MFSARRGPICAETNPCFRSTPGPTGRNDPSDLNNPVSITYTPVAGIGVFASPGSGGSKGRKAKSKSVASRDATVKSFLEQLRQDLKAAGLSLAGADLYDMQGRKHAKFKMFNAWTNSATEIDVNVEGAQTLAGELSQLSSVKDSTRMAALAYATILVRHEVHHVKQFKSHGGHPKTYKQMCDFEKDAYGEDAKWMDANRATMTKLGMTDEVIDVFAAAQKDAAKKFETIANLKTEAARKDEMLKEKFLPSHKNIDELYK